MNPRPLREIADDILNTWARPSYAARPYIEAMRTMDRITDLYFTETGEEQVRRFLVNSPYWRGEHARRIKFELRSLLPENQ